MVNGLELVDGLEFDENPVFNDEISTKTRLETQIAINEGHLLLDGDSIVTLDQLEGEAFFIDRFE